MPNKKFFYAIGLLVFSAQLALAALPFPKNAAYPGGVAVISIPLKSEHAPQVYYQNHRVLTVRNHQRWYAVVGIPLSAEPGRAELLIKNSSREVAKIPFHIGDKEYPLHHITIKDTSKVTPDPVLARKIEAQIQETQDILKQWTDQPVVPIEFILPVRGRFSSPFGIRRIYNQLTHGRHTGLDIAAPTGTPIIAPAAGRVIAVKDYVLTGNTVFIDHGQGLISIYCHMHRIDVKPGQTLRQGEILGTVGATGRVTGPHLHWTVSLNGAKVNPLLLVKLPAS